MRQQRRLWTRVNKLTLGRCPLLQRRLFLYSLDNVLPRPPHILLVSFVQVGFQLGFNNALLVGPTYGDAMRQYILKNGVKLFHCIDIF
jgi:hypothetical protein